MVRLDVLRGLVSEVKARDEYGVIVVDGGLSVDLAATEAQRARLREFRGPLPTFDFGPPLDEILMRAKDETGLEPPERPVFHEHTISFT
jgi:N-methylhydantoinase B